MHRFIFRLTWVCSVCVFANATEAAPDLSGVWDSEAWATEGWSVEPPFTEAGRAAQAAWAAAPDDDPSHRCLIPLGRIISGPFPHEFIQQEDRITIIYEYEHQVRRVFMDGRPHPEDWFPTPIGHSIGWWEGNTLVVDTVGVEDGGLFRPQGFPYTADLHLVERYTLEDGGARLTAEIRIEDSSYYREPWIVKKRYRRLEDDIQYYECIVRPHLLPSSD
jgi:hypothetical protein